MVKNIPDHFVSRQSSYSQTGTSFYTIQRREYAELRIPVLVFWLLDASVAKLKKVLPHCEFNPIWNTIVSDAQDVVKFLKDRTLPVNH